MDKKNTVLSLIDKGADINICDCDEWTALKYACGKGFKDIVQMLIDNGASIDEDATHDRSSLDIAALYGHDEIMNLLLLNGAEKKRRASHIRSGVSRCKRKAYKNCYDSQMKSMKKKQKYLELV
jgi:ankyrin repeat protein